MRLLRITKGRTLRGFEEWRLPKLELCEEGKPDWRRFYEEQELWEPSMKGLGLKHELDKLIGCEIEINMKHPIQMFRSGIINAVLRDVSVKIEQPNGMGRTFHQLYLHAKGYNEINAGWVEKVKYYDR